MLLDRWMGRLGRHPLRLRQGEARALNLNMKRCRRFGWRGGVEVVVGEILQTNQRAGTSITKK